MATRSVEAPGTGMGEYVTIRQAADFLCLSVPTFRRLVGLDSSDPDVSLPGVRDWVRPVRIGGAIRFHWLGVVYLAHRLAQLAPVDAAAEE